MARRILRFQLNLTMNVMAKNEIEKAGARLRELRQQSLIATRQGDFRRVAQLTAETVRVNRELQNDEKSLFVYGGHHHQQVMR